MKKEYLNLLIIGIILIMIAIIGYVVFFELPEEKHNETGSNNIPDGEKNITMTMYEFGNDTEWDIDYYKSLGINYKSLEEGDTVHITGNISGINYDKSSDTTNISVCGFKVTEKNKYKGYCETFVFIGNITGEFNKDDKVEITGTIKHIIFSSNNFDYDLELFEGQWQNESYFNQRVKSHPLNYHDGLANYQRGFKPMDPSYIKKSS